MVSHDCCVALPRGAMGLSAVCDCGISWSYSLTMCCNKGPFPIISVLNCNHTLQPHHKILPGSIDGLPKV